MMQSVVREYMVDKTKIGFIRFIFEAYEGLAVVTTLEPGTGHIRLTIPPGRQDEAYMVTQSLKKDFYFESR
ncbi:DUF4911 domain-containing protein [uncultured Desulfobacter sp.]|uniref:DUF4911 domain-containing protein n=1 Tax=uncultured Desulfobacter sp. TaxID=240139 RepID=UPI002AABDCA1|nr:DUF4911 domain-containing protein [uncultured Desulfobacter sp.]